MSGRGVLLVVSNYLRKRPFRATQLALAILLSSVWFSTADRLEHWNWMSDMHKLPAYLLGSRGNVTFIRVWVDRPIQSVRNDSWFVGFRTLDLGLEYTGTFQPPGTVLLHGVHYDLYIPIWLPIMLLVLPTVLLLRFRPQTSAKIPCRSCGYDLQGNESGVCPECGTKVIET